MGTYAEWTPTPAGWVWHQLRRALWWPWRPVLRVWRWIEQTPPLIALWERRAGVDHTGWRVRNLHGGAALVAGEVGVVTGYVFRRRRRHYTVTFPGGNTLGTALPAPEHVELIGPPADRSGV